MNWNKAGGWLAVGILAACVVVIIISIGTSTPAQSSTVEPASKATLMIEVSNGRHGSVWRFVDQNRTCYFNSSGGIWCDK